MITKIETQQVPEFYAAGIAVRTTNENGRSGNDIGQLWGRFMGEGMQKIGGRVGDDVYGLYTGYESDYTGRYTALVGCRVNNLADVPEGFMTITVPAGKYQVYTLEGKLPEMIYEGWQEIWNIAQNRKYTTDFELYVANDKGLECTEVKIFLAVE
jgi:predicted transcriptional regulator YdeE